jgi:hypothetical protein
LQKFAKNCGVWRKLEEAIAKIRELAKVKKISGFAVSELAKNVSGLAISGLRKNMRLC